MGITFEKLKAKVEDLHEFNPMLGTRGCRLDVLYPEIAEMQTEAIISAAIECLEGRRPAHHARNHGAAGIRDERAALCQEDHQGQG